MKKSGLFLRDASNRLTFEMSDVDSLDYPKFVSRVITHFQLRPCSKFVVGFDEMFCEYTDGEFTVGLEWDNWSGFIVVAKSPEAEPLVNTIGEYLVEG